MLSLIPNVHYLSISDARIVDVIAVGTASLSLKTLSITESSVEVVSIPQKATQSFTTIPPAITSLPLFTVPACTWYFTLVIKHLASLSFMSYFLNI